MQPRRRKDGTVGKIKGVPILQDLSEEDYKRLAPAKDGTFGSSQGAFAVDRFILVVSQHTAGGLTLRIEIDVRASLCCWRGIPEVHCCVRMESAGSSPSVTDFITWLLRTPEGTSPFTTITCNKSWRTAAHIDDGDLRSGFGRMCTGEFEGCDLVFPRYRTAVRYREGDVLLANVHQVHGNTPLLTPDRKVPLPGGNRERLVCVFYYSERMDQCESTMERGTRVHQQTRERRRDQEEEGESQGKGGSQEVKTIIMIIGAGATGKTTLSCALVGENAVQHHVDLGVVQKGKRKRFKAPYFSARRSPSPGISRTQVTQLVQWTRYIRRLTTA